jgi:hypothetical protein
MMKRFTEGIFADHLRLHKQGDLETNIQRGEKEMQR